MILRSATGGANLRPDLWGQLPLELIREILFLLAQSSEEQARKLRFVSSDVNVLVLPILFGHVVMLLPEHVIRFTTTLLPKRKNYIPASRSKLHLVPRSLSSYKVDTWVMVVNDQRPSIESALASVGPVFTGLSKLVITGQNLSSNAFWLRQHHIHPKHMMIVHHGSPHLVNFYDPIFRSLTHLYTCITHGHRYSSVADLPSLTHLAVNTRRDLPDNTALNVVTSLYNILATCPSLQLLVLTMDCSIMDESQFESWSRLLSRCSEDTRFVFLPHYRNLRDEWDSITEGRNTVWYRAKLWREAGVGPHDAFGRNAEEYANPSELEVGPEWEIDLVQRDDYHPPEDPEAIGEKNFHLGQL